MTTFARLLIFVLILLVSHLVGADTAQYSYDTNGRVTSIVAPTWSIQYTYDQVGNVTQMVRTTTGGLVISSFSPTADIVGATVAIQGAGFSATPANNIVKFNGTTATVTAASTTSLTTTVPASATTGPISVTVGANTATSQTSFTVNATPSDLTVSNLTAGTVTVNADGSYAIPVSFTVNNVGQGTAKASWSDFCYVSADATLDATDGAIGSAVHSTDLAPGASYAVNLTCTTSTSIAPGSYTLFAKADGVASAGLYAPGGVVAESNEANNTASATVTLPARDLPDLVASALSVGTITVNQNGSYAVPVSFTVTNSGGGVARATWSDNCYLSNDATLDTSDTAVGNVTRATDLAVGAQYTALMTCQIPATVAAGNYTIFVKTDGGSASGQYAAGSVVTELNKNNNTLSSSVTLPQRPDLAVSNLSLGAVSVSQQGAYSFTASFTVTNLGASAASASWTDYCYLSADGALDGSDLALGSAVRSINLAAGANYTVSLNCSTPTSTSPGSYTVFVKTDAMASGGVYVASDVIAETDESNNVASGMITLPQRPDLAVSNLALGFPVRNANNSYTFTANFTVTNIGGSAAKASWNDYCYLSTDGTLDTTDTALGSTVRSVDLAAGSSYVAALSCTTSTTITAGSYTAFVKADGAASGSLYAATSVLAEPDKSNNVAATTVVLTDKPDLIVSGLTLGTPARNASGAYTFTASFTVTNAGSVTAAAGWYDYCYLSADGVLDTTDIALGNAYRSTSLAGGASYAVTLTCTTPASFNAGPYTIFVKTDGAASGGVFTNTGAITEFNETNNVASAAITLPQWPDLTVSGLTVGTPTRNSSGQYTFTASFTVTNSGESIAYASWTDYCYLSSDATLGTTDWTLGAASHTTNLSPGASYMATLTCTTGASFTPGAYTVFVKADGYGSGGFYSAASNSLVEGNENNNVASAAITLPQLPDLTVSGLTVGTPTRNSSGQYTFTTSFTVTNSGESIAYASWADYCYLSSDGTLDTSDWTVGAASHTVNLNPGASYTANLTCTTIASFTPGAYTVFVKADGYASGGFYSAASNSLVEGNETNNVASAGITLPQLPDLTVSGLTVGTPTRNGSGQYTFTTSFTVTNSGESIAYASWTDYCYLSSDAALGTTDWTLGAASHTVNLNPGASYMANLTCTTLASFTPGTYTVFVKADGYTSGGFYSAASNSLVEGNETNNTLSASITLPQLPDLTVSGLTVGTPSRNSSGQYTFSASFTVTNSGESIAYASWTDYCYLSADGTLDTSDWTLAAASHTVNLNPGASYTASLTCMTPASFSPGTYTVFTKADGYTSGGFYSAASNSLVEGNEANNVISTSITLPQWPDLTVSGLTVGTPTRNASGQYTFTASFTVTNSGESIAYASWTDYCYLSNDATLGTTDWTLGAASRTTNLNPGASYTANLTCITPASFTPGAYTVFVKVDGYTSSGFYSAASNSLVEGNEANNVASAAITLPQLPDLAVSGLSLGTPTKNGSGVYTFTASFTVTNSGESIAYANWTDYCFLSSDATLNTSDWALGALTRTVSVNPGASYMVNLSCSTPASFTAGSYTVFVKADGSASGGFFSATSILAEADKTNNVTSGSITLP